MFLYIMQVCILAVLSGIFYRLGGWGDEGRRMYPKVPTWLFNTKARDLGCAFICMFGMMKLVPIVDAPWWIHNIAFLLLFAALTTYWDWLGGFDNFWLHGAMCGAAYFPYLFFGLPVLGLLHRCLALLIGMGAVSAWSGNDVVEECGRGSLLVLTLPLLLI